MQTQLLALPLSLCLGMVFTFLFRLLALRLGVVDVPGGMLKKHDQATPYLGGLAVLCSFWCSVWLLGYDQFNSYFIGLTAIVLIGLIDDIFPEVSWVIHFWLFEGLQSDPLVG